MNDMMMGHRIVAKIHPDMTLVFIDGLDEINQNDYNRQVLTVYTDGWALSDNQTMHIAFSRAEDDEDLTETYINHVMMAYDQDERAYFVRLPKEVLSERGTWFFCISVRDSWDAETGAADNVSNTTIYQFHVRATLEDYSGDAPSGYDIAALYSTALSAVGAAQAARDAAKDTADQVSEDLEKVDEMYQALDDFEKNVMSAKEAAGIAELAAQSAAASASTAQTAVENIETSISEIEADVSDAKAMASAAQAEAESKYEKPSGGIPVDDLSESVKVSLQKAETALQSAPVTSVAGKTGNVALSKSDVGLGNVDNTADAVKSVSHAETAEKAEKDQIGNIIHVTYATKTSVSTAQQTADEAKSIAQGRNRSVAFDSLEAMKTALKAMGADALKVGDNVYIRAVDVPDYWVSAVLPTNSGETGYFDLSPLETPKIDLTDYQTKNDNSLQTGSKNVVGAINELNSTVSEIEADVSDAKATASAAQAEAESKYEKPSGGIPETDLSAGVQNKLNPNYKTVLIDIVYPVGSIYMSINNVSPATFFGGTWERIQDKFLLAAGSAYAAGSTGGSASHNHDYRISYLEGRNLGFNASVEGTGAYNYETGTFSQRTLAGAIRTSMPNSQERTETAFSIATLNGNTSIESSLPPYLAVYVWKRTE